MNIVGRTNTKKPMASVRQNWMMRLRPREDCWLTRPILRPNHRPKKPKTANRERTIAPPPDRSAPNIPAPPAALAAEPPLDVAAVTVAALAEVASSGKAAITPSVKALPG